MSKIKMIFNILYWAFDVLSVACGHVEEILNTYENYKDGGYKRRKRKKR